MSDAEIEQRFRGILQPASQLNRSSAAGQPRHQARAAASPEGGNIGAALQFADEDLLARMALRGDQDGGDNLRLVVSVSRSGDLRGRKWANLMDAPACIPP
eukprot:TRINITY_DN64049_c0_g1_i1.p1 TRINITY_DN64049_c0_g1~~TRINITY_DN64049_c0_g1_i1.p1  ORF type:complete len:101 (+),score=10.29 TRINITY_DN64049_c0_g1_i1:285-587(+)